MEDLEDMEDLEEDMEDVEEEEALAEAVWRPVGPDRDVSEGPGDDKVAVDADGGEGEDGGGAEEDVGEDPGYAGGGGQGPGAN